MAHPFLGGRALDAGASALAAEGVPIAAKSIGYIQMVDLQALNSAAASANVTLALSVLPGSFVHPGTELARIMPPARPDTGLTDAICGAFAIADLRSFDQDPRFGILTLTEIASRALSPAINDPGTAIDILGRQLRVLSVWAERADPERLYPHVLVPGLHLSDLMSDAFDAIGRDGAGMIEVQVRLQKTLHGLARQAPQVFGGPAAHLSRRALVLAEAALALEEDRDRLRRLSAEITALAESAPEPALRKA